MTMLILDGHAGYSINQGFMLGNKEMVGTVNASREAMRPHRVFATQPLL
jgi:hypothetical protein